MTDPVSDKQSCTAGFRYLAKHEPDAPGEFHVRIVRGEISVHQALDQQRLRTPAWTFDGEMPGGLIEVGQDQPVQVFFQNAIAPSDRTPFEAHIDGNPKPLAASGGAMHHGAWIEHGLRPGFVIHLHGAVVPPIYDGNPGTTDPLTPGERTRRLYDNRQRPMLLWYHDHSMGQTAGTVYAGLAALYVIRGPTEQVLERTWGLPCGGRELLLVLQDKSFERDARGQLTGRFTYHIEPNKEWVGEDLLTNGRVRPSLQVEPQPYRVRVLNATNGRFLKLYLRRGDDNTTLTVAPVTWIGCDGGLLPAALPADPRQGIFLGPANRADLVIDFRALEPGPWKLVSRIFDSKNPYNNGDRDETGDADIDVVMQFAVHASREPHAPFAAPPRLSDDVPSRDQVRQMIQAGQITPRDVDMTLSEVEGPPLLQLINGRRFHEPIDPTREQFRAGEWIRLRIRNDTPDAHPIHLHLVTFWVEGRSTAAFTPTQETGLLDTVWCPPGSGGAVTTVLFQLPTDPPLSGRYMFHCHILEHEDHDMMRPFDVIPKTA
jgi:spore coat protein A